MRKFIISFLSLCICFSGLAASLSSSQARQNVMDFLSLKRQASVHVKGLNRIAGKSINTQSALQGDSSIYVFNVAGGGFVIASGDDATEPILGYSDSGTFDAASIPDGLKDMLQLYREDIAYARTRNITPKEKAAMHPAVDYLMPTTWSQTAPYNNSAPLDGSSRSVTGCVATAMAQIMSYLKWPSAATAAIPAYTTGDTKVAMPQLDATTFNWSILKNSYSDSETGAAVDEVAKLMLYCGQAMTMNYTAANSTAAADVTSAMVNYFGYDIDCQYVQRVNYTDVDWDNMIYNDIAAHHPVLYGATRTTGGSHVFVVDGYDGAGNYHVNWGWNGTSNGYFRLSALTPGLLGGGTPSEDWYTLYPVAVTGIHAPTPYTGEVGLQVTKLMAVNSSVTKTSVSSLFQGLVYQFAILNPTKTTHKFHFLLSLYDAAGNYISSFDDRDHQPTLAPKGSEVSNPVEQYYGDNMAAGTYQVRADYMLYDDVAGTWSERRPCIDNDKYYISLTVSEDQLTATYQNVAPAVVSKVDGFTINSVTFGTDPMVSFPTTCTVNVTNTGTSNYSVLNLYENSTGTNALTAIGVYIDPGETDNVVLHFVPATSGDAVTYVLTGTGFTNTSTTTKVKPLPETNIYVNGSFNSDAYWKNSELHYYGNLMVVTANVTNNNTSDAFTSGVYVTLTGLSALNGTIETVADTLTKTAPVSIPAKGTGSVTFTFDGLNYDYIYRVTLGYLDYHNNYLQTRFKEGGYFHLDAYPFTIQTINYTTYCNARPWKLPEGVDAYVVTGVNSETHLLQLALIPAGTIIPANMGVLIHGEKKSYNFDFEPAESVTYSPEANYLVGTTAQVTPSAEAGYVYFKLTGNDTDGNGVNDNNPGFYYGTESGAPFEVAANSAYLKLPSTLAGGTDIFFLDAEGMLTSIDQPQYHAPITGDVYDILGRKVATSLSGLQKGIYICNGKKIIVR